MIHQSPLAVVEEGKPAAPIPLRSLYKIVSEHKDVAKVVIVLQSIVSSFKVGTNDVLKEMDQFKELWQEVCLVVLCGKYHKRHLVFSNKK